MLRLWFALSGLFILVQAASAQLVWPGDVNNNGIVNQVDLLYVGAAFGASGPARDEVSTEWEAKPAPAPWAEIFPSGLNYFYADADGNGLVDENDLEEAIEGNFGLTHGILSTDGYQNATAGDIAPSLRLEASTLVAEPGEIITVDLFIEQDEGPPADVYGLALQLSYTADLLEGDDGPDFDLAEDGWLGAGNDLLLDIYEGDAGRAGLGLSRTDQLAVTVEPESIGSFTIVIEDIIVGLFIDTLELSIDSVLLVDADLSPRATVPDTLQILVVKDRSVLSVERIPPAEVQIFPNPSRGRLGMETSHRIKAWQLIDALGRTYELTVPAVTGRFQLDLPNLPPGHYWLRIQTDRGVLTKRLLLIAP